LSGYLPKYWTDFTHISYTSAPKVVVHLRFTLQFDMINTVYLTYKILTAVRRELLLVPVRDSSSFHFCRVLLSIMYLLAVWSGLVGWINRWSERADNVLWTVCRYHSPFYNKLPGLRLRMQSHLIKQFLCALAEMLCASLVTRHVDLCRLGSHTQYLWTKSHKPDANGVDARMA
jgi:hypothetical protein